MHSRSVQGRTVLEHKEWHGVPVVFEYREFPGSAVPDRNPSRVDGCTVLVAVIDYTWGKEGKTVPFLLKPDGQRHVIQGILPSPLETPDTSYKAFPGQGI